MIFLCFFSCKKSSIDNVSINILNNNKIPLLKDTLKILGIGNSFTEDAMEYLPLLCKDFSINNVILGQMTYNGSSLEDHMNFIKMNQPIYTLKYWDYLKEDWEIEYNKKASSILSKQWDIIVLQQVSYLSGNYQSIQPYLNQIIHLIQKPDIVFVWHMTWAYASCFKDEKFSAYLFSPTFMQYKIIETTNYIKESSIKLIIPSGIIIEKLRSEKVINNPPLDLTRDGMHMDYGIGRYALAYTWYDILLSEYTKKETNNNNLIIPKGNRPINFNNKTYIDSLLHSHLEYIKYGNNTYFY